MVRTMEERGDDEGRFLPQVDKLAILHYMDFKRVWIRCEEGVCRLGGATTALRECSRIRASEPE